MGTETEVLKVEYIHLVKDFDDIKARLCNMEKSLNALKIDVIKIVTIGALVGAFISAIVGPTLVGVTVYYVTR